MCVATLKATASYVSAHLLDCSCTFSFHELPQGLPQVFNDNFRCQKARQSTGAENKASVRHHQCESLFPGTRLVGSRLQMC